MASTWPPLPTRLHQHSPNTNPPPFPPSPSLSVRCKLLNNYAVVLCGAYRFLGGLRSTKKKGHAEKQKSRETEITKQQKINHKTQENNLRNIARWHLSRSHSYKAIWQLQKCIRIIKIYQGNLTHLRVVDMSIMSHKYTSIRRRGLHDVSPVQRDHPSSPCHHNPRVCTTEV